MILGPDGYPLARLERDKLEEAGTGHAFARIDLAEVRRYLKNDNLAWSEPLHLILPLGKSISKRRTRSWIFLY